ncbi:quaternary amine ABC transporter ATP-binding protein [Microvirga pakistanensis]|uniref:quaternary amine ABC transporter ATP-binding protein n=1 Tax=Microvirga pakistanensis TaxID=1682650 RepID=UPI001FCE777A|nr:glycine betaine/L-proline ABC transporter ATP-binding protein [Microvirga pakistanensis]
MNRIRIERLYKIFGDAPKRAFDMLAAGSGKDAVLATTGHVVALNDVNIEVPAGSIFMIMGLSGSGKSTLARCINRLIEPSAGSILLDGENMLKANDAQLREIRRTRISMVFQHFALLPNRTVLENAEFGLKLRGVPIDVRRNKAREVLSIVGLSAWENKYPSALSGGMRQRVGLARALATDADVLIMDEAFSALDPLIRGEMQDELLRLQRVLQKTILFITHDFQEALKLGNRIAIMSDGAVVQEGTPQEIVAAPQNDYVAAFTRDIDRARVFDATAAMVEEHPLIMDTKGSLEAGGAAAPGRFVINPQGRILGVISEEGARIHVGAPLNGGALSQNFATVSASAKLIEVAGACRGNRPVAVVDDEGKYRGRVDPSQLLACIASQPATAQPKGIHP